MTKDDWAFVGDGKFEHTSRKGVLLVMNNQRWSIEKDGVRVAQALMPTDPFAWANGLLSDNEEFWR